MYEYIFHATVFDNDSIVENIKQFNSKKIIQIYPQLSFTNKIFIKSPFEKSKNFNELIEQTSKNLIEYFKIITKNYNNFSLGLSSGFDSRLTLALLITLNIKPFIYTGGYNTSDVKISQSICKEFGLEFQNYYEDETVEYEKVYL